MENKIDILSHEEFGQVRIIREDDTILFCGADTAKALGYTNPPDAIRRHCKNNGIVKRDTVTIRTNRWGSEDKLTESMTFITEGNVYRLIVRSKLPAAERFEHWLFDEVLPCIRKYGAYITPAMRAKLSRNPSYIQELVDMLQREEELNAKLMKQMAEEKDKLDHALAENKQLKKDNGELAMICVDLMPKAAYYDAFVQPGDNTNLTITAKELCVSPRNFIKLLEATNFLYRTSTGDLIPRQKWMDAGYFVVKDYFAHGHLGAYTLVTPVGKAYLRDLLDGLFEVRQE